MSPVVFKKMPCRPVEFNGQAPLYCLLSIDGVIMNFKGHLHHTKLTLGWGLMIIGYRQVGSHFTMSGGEAAEPVSRDDSKTGVMTNGRRDHVLTKSSC